MLFKFVGDLLQAHKERDKIIVYRSSTPMPVLELIACINPLCAEFASSDATCTRAQFAATVPVCGVWVGLARLVAGNSFFFWLDSTNSTYRHWASGQPFGGTQHCVSLWSGARGGLVGFWDNVYCDNPDQQPIRKAVCAQCPSECLKC
ncbi:hypothetical protein Ddc_18704 [Ditylenchus destructor]|nr:hypothetical protein Ddc_18704 [Ditylenchus destructor]